MHPSLTPVSAARGAICLLALASLLPAAWAGAPKQNAPPVPVIRWAEGKPGCTFSRGDDGKYRYGLGNEDVTITLAVDSQELQKTRRRLEQIFGVLLTVRYRGAGALDVRTDNISLEFVKHFHVAQTSLDPDDFSAKIQSDTDDLVHETERLLQKHPEKKEEKEAFLRGYQKDASELLEFLSTRSLRPLKLDAGNPEAHGWVFFSTKSRWVGDWKKQEDFVLRFPFADRVFEIPFRLPPREGELLLRRRPN